MRDRETPELLVGRQAELGLVRSALSGARDGALHTMAVVGEAGIGKTRLLQECLAAARSSGFVTFTGGGRELGQDLPLVPLEEAFDLHDRDSDPARVELSRLARADTAGGDPTERRAAFHHLLVEWLCDLAERSPVLVAIDDAQWVDASTLAALSRLLASLETYPVAVFVFRRPLPRRPELASLLAQLERLPRHRQLRLEPLGETEVQQLARHVTGRSDGTVDRELPRAGGNPLLVIELAQHMDRWADHAGDASSSLPVSLRENILGRLTFLSDRCRRVLRSAALLGPEVDLELLSIIERIQSRELLLILEEALEMEILVQGERGLAFRHDLVHAAIYEESPAAVRAEQHADVANALADAAVPALRLAPHLLRARPPLVPKELAQWMRVARDVAGRAPGVAAALLETVVDAAPDDWAERDATTAELAQLLFWAGEWQRAERVARDALPTSRGAIEAALLMTLASALSRRGNLESSTDAVAEASARADASLRPRLLAFEARGRFQRGELARAHEAASEAVAVAAEAGDHATRCLALTALASVAFMRANVEGAAAIATDACAIVDQLRDGGGYELDDPYVWLGTVLVELGSYPEATKALDVAAQRAEKHGNFVAIVIAHRSRALMKYRLGRWDDAIAEAQTSVSLVEAADTHWGVLDRTLLARIALYQDRLADAERLLAQAEALADMTDYRVPHDSSTRLARALVEECTVSPEQAFATLDAARPLIDESGCLLMYLRIAPDHVRLAIAAGQTDAAADLVEVLEDLLSRTPSAPVESVALRCRGLLEDDPDLLLRATELHRQLGDLPALAGTQEDAGVVLLKQGRVDEALTPLDAALAFWSSVDARRNAARLRATLREAGVTRRGAVAKKSQGWDSLTETEQRVIDLLGEGLYYREVGERLFISRRTVETHVANIFRKLDLRSRRELEAALTSRGGHAGEGVNAHRYP